MKLSLVVPCYNEEGNICAFYKEAKRVFDAEDYEYEIVFVNDGSKDKTQEELEKVYNLHEANIVIEMFSRNFGKEAAIYAGFQKASGDLITVIDADLQQRPEIVVKMVKILLENEEYDCVAAYQEGRHEKQLVVLRICFTKSLTRQVKSSSIQGLLTFVRSADRLWMQY